MAESVVMYNKAQEHGKSPNLSFDILDLAMVNRQREGWSIVQSNGRHYALILNKLACAGSSYVHSLAISVRA